MHCGYVVVAVCYIANHWQINISKKCIFHKNYIANHWQNNINKKGHFHENYIANHCQKNINRKCISHKNERSVGFEGKGVYLLCACYANHTLGCQGGCFLKLL